MYASLHLKFDCQFKQNLREHRIIIIGNRVAGKEGVDSEFLCALLLQYFERLK